VLHLRLLTPPDCTDEVVELLCTDRAVATVAVLRAAAVRPAGDVVLADVAREDLSRVLAALEPFELGRRGAIAIEPIDVALSEVADQAEQAAPGDPADAVVWEEVAARSSEDATLSGSYLVFIVAATLLGAVALVLDSPVLIVGAMVLGPEFGPLAGLAVATVQGRRREAGRSLFALTAGFVVAIAVTLLAVLLANALGLLPADLSSARRTQTAFVSRPDVFTVVVAAIAGVAGMVSLTSAKSSALVGVLVSVTTVPAAGGVALGVATGTWGDVRGSAAQLSVNLVILSVSATLTLAIQRWRQVQRGHRVRPRTTTGPP